MQQIHNESKQVEFGSMPTCNRKPVGSVAGLEAEVELFPRGIDAITAFEDHLDSPFFLVRIPTRSNAV